MSDIYQMEEEEVVKKVVNTPLLPRIKKSQYKSVDPMAINKSQLKDIRLRLDLGAQDRLKLKMDPSSPHTKLALETLGVAFEDLRVAPRTDFLVNGEQQEETDIRYTLYLLQQSELIRKVMLERNRQKKQEQQEQRRMKHASEMSRQSHSMASMYSNYKSPTEMVDSWIEETTEQASKYQQKTDVLKKEKMMEIALSHEVYKEKKLQNDSLSQKKDSAKIKYFEKKVLIAQKFNDQMEEIREKKKQDERQNILIALRTRQQQLEKEEKQYDLIQQKQMEQQEMKFQRLRDQFELKQQRANQQRKLQQSLSEGKTSPLGLQTKMVESEQRRKMHLDSISKRMSNSLNALNTKRQHKDLQQSQSQQSLIMSYLEKQREKEMKESKRESSIAQSLVVKSEKHKGHAEHFEKRRQLLNSQLENKFESINEKLSKQVQQVQEKQEEKSILLEEKIVNKRIKIEKTLQNFDRVKQAFREKLEQMLKKQQDQRKKNVTAFQRRQLTIEHLIAGRVHSQHEIEDFSRELDRKLKRKKKQKKEAHPKQQAQTEQ